MMIPKRVCVATPVFFVPQFLKRRSVSFCLQKIYYSSFDDTVDVPLDYIGFLLRQ